MVAGMDVFREHFANLCAGARPLLFYSRAGGVKEFDSGFYQQVRRHLMDKVGAGEG